MNIDMRCQLEKSRLNTKLYVCKNCKTVVGENSINENRLCPVLLDKYANDPEYPQIRLDKIQIEDHNGNVLQTIGPDKPNDWWNSQQDVVTRTEINQIPNDKKQCSQQQIDDRLAICQGCEFYKDNSCLKCGCTLNRGKNYMNKLLWADQSCPIGKWGKITE
jgi:hypothetical protein